MCHLDTLPRYKSLAGFPIYACGVRYVQALDMHCGARGIYSISNPRSGYIFARRKYRKIHPKNLYGSFRVDFLMFIIR